MEHRVQIEVPQINPLTVWYAGLLAKRQWSANCSCGESYEAVSEGDVRAWARYHSEANCD